jgi:hypothetical protein
MDFSAAQCEGFILAFVEVFQESLGDTRSEQQLCLEAEAVLKGCTEHFRCAVKKASEIPSIVPVEKCPNFLTQAWKLAETQDLTEFEDIAHSLMMDYKGLAAFFAFWLRHANALMSLAAKRVMTEEMWLSIPDTTNAQEAMHWSIYCKGNTQHDLIDGMETLHAIAKNFEEKHKHALGKLWWHCYFH